ncbi:MAG: YabP/YqfC family sporulation protein [Lachnospiraceae bacterium]|nr:YabP/YqfC family sporulation protein [Lachnospiraceae bacterium]MBQ8318929.1 YabP/YqfC family sporulation protein [Lachnospiraceae bacterium]
MVKAILIDTKSLYIEGYKSIEYFDDYKIIISLNKRKSLQISGQQLVIDSFGNYNLKITGIIDSIQYINN